VREVESCVTRAKVLASGAVEQHGLYVFGQDHSFGRCGVCTKQLVPAQTGTCIGTRAACRHYDCMGIGSKPNSGRIMIYRK
jgi:hypothetical protein